MARGTCAILRLPGVPSRGKRLALSQHALQKCRSQSPRQRGRSKGSLEWGYTTDKLTLLKKPPDDSTCERDRPRARQRRSRFPAGSPASIPLPAWNAFHKYPRERPWWLSSQQAAPSSSHSEHLRISQSQRQVLEKAGVLSYLRPDPWLRHLGLNGYTSLPEY